MWFMTYWLTTSLQSLETRLNKLLLNWQSQISSFSDRFSQKLNFQSFSQKAFAKSVRSAFNMLMWLNTGQYIEIW